ncbi:hypothetical protein ACFSHQ_20975 [Gemmobacter lanyuensis]
MTGTAKSVRDAPHDGAEGNGLNARSLTDCTIDVVLEDCDGLARLGALTRCSATVDATNMGRNGANVTGAVYIDDTGSETTDTVLRVHSREKSGSAVIQYPCRINGSGTGYDVEVSYAGPHTLSAGIVTRADGASFRAYRNNGAIFGRGSVVFDSSGNADITHNAGTTPSFVASHEGGWHMGFG